MSDLSIKHSEEVLKKQCEIIGVDYEKVDFKARDWFMQHSWTKEQEIEFIGWLQGYLIGHRYATKRSARHEAEKIVMNYGWTTK